MHNGDAYFTVGDGLVRITPTGQILYVGIDQMPVNPIHSARRHGAGVVSAYTTLISLAEISGAQEAWGGNGVDATHNIATRVWGSKNQGWHPIASVSPAGPDPGEDDYPAGWRWQGQGLYYDKKNNTLWWVLADVYTPFMSSTNQVDLYAQTVVHDVAPDLDDVTYGYKHAASGWFIMPPFDAGAAVLKKDWNQVSVYGSCFDDGSSIEVMYRTGSGIAEGLGCFTSGESYGFHYANGDWYSMGTESFDPGNTMAGGVIRWDFALPRDFDASEALELKFRVTRGTDPLKSPWIHAVHLQHHDFIQDYFRFTVGVTLPPLCITDICGDEVPGYDQRTWDDRLHEATCATAPVPFVDVDLRSYFVRVESASRRISAIGRDPVSNARTYDITWSLVLTQESPATICGDA